VAIAAGEKPRGCYNRGSANEIRLVHDGPRFCAGVGGPSLRLTIIGVRHAAAAAGKQNQQLLSPKFTARRERRNGACRRRKLITANEN